jgi:hypothetical protein
VEVAFKAKRKSQMFGKEKTTNYCSWTPLISTFAMQDWKKQPKAAFTCVPLVSVNN